MASESGCSPRVSVILNLYNGARFLQETLDSLLAQSFVDWEAIVVDDGSSDGSLEIVESIGDGRFRCERLEQNQGLGVARSLALRRARGDWVAFLDQDDLWSADKLARQMQRVDEDPEGRLGMVYGWAERFNATGRRWPFDRWHRYGRLPEGNVYLDLFRTPGFVAMSSALVRRSALEKALPIPSSVRAAVDHYLFAAVARDTQAAALQQLCCRYREHEGNMTGPAAARIHRELIASFEAHRPWLPAKLYRRRVRIHQAMLGFEELRGGGRVGPSLRRILVEGSTWHLLSRPFAKCFRALRRNASFGGGK